jgi:hypothetical protein
MDEWWRARRRGAEPQRQFVFAFQSFRFSSQSPERRNRKSHAEVICEQRARRRDDVRLPLAGESRMGRKNFNRRRTGLRSEHGCDSRADDEGHDFELRGDRRHADRPLLVRKSRIE